jgi:SM-20-related protein
MPNSIALPATTDYFGDALQLDMLTNLSTHGWSQHSLFLPETLRLALASECADLAASGALKSAGVGRSAVLTVQSTIRGDQILWLNPGQSSACDAYLAIMESLRLLLNQHFYLGLEEYESHFAFYAPGRAYLRHLDRFRDDDSRTVSVVIYLNQDWLPGQGGALRLHPQGLASLDVSPVGATMVLFLSAEMLHEVLPASRDRLSLTGWFRRRA